MSTTTLEVAQQRRRIAAEPQFHVTVEEHHAGGSTLLGFWIYLMSDCLLFAGLFATYGVLGGEFAGGPTARDVLELPLVAVNTTLLLLSSLTYGFAMLNAYEGRSQATLIWLALTGFLGAGFIGIEVHEFGGLIHEGNGPQRSAFLSSFFTLVGTHGAHVSVGILWLATLIVQVRQRGLTADNMRRLQCLSLFWHFLDVVWIGVFTFVYLMGTLR
jgi:cytochrome o ubiquinol oxidase subunit 3